MTLASLVSTANAGDSNPTLAIARDVHDGQLQVRVIDKLGALPGATIVVEGAGGVSVHSMTDVRGQALFQGLPRDRTYTVPVSFPGFGEVRQTGVSVAGSLVTKVNVRLRAELPESIEFHCPLRPMVDLDKTGLSTVFRAGFLDGLPGAHGHGGGSRGSKAKRDRHRERQPKAEK